MAGSTDVVDLTGDTELTLRLMDDPWRWRERLVETFEFRSAQYVRVRSSYQVRLSRDLIDPGGEVAARMIRVRMPVTTRPKQPLVGFNVEANDERAYLPLRTEIAATQAAYLGMLIASSHAGPAVSSGLTAPVLRAICSFTPGVYRGFTAWRHEGRLAAYLRAGLGVDVKVGQVAHWRRMLEPVRYTLTAVLGEPPLQTSSSEEFLLAVPLVEPVPQSTDAVEALVASYATAVAAADTSSDEVLLERLGDYGRRWEVLVDATLPVDEPRLVKVEEERPLGWRMGGHCTQRLWLADAPSYHLEARALDPAVVFRRKVEIRDTRGVLVGFDVWNGRRVTDDAIAIYSSEPLRPYLADMLVRLRPVWTVRALILCAQALGVLALSVVALVDLGDDRVGKLAILTVPTSLVVALLMAREQTPLAGRLLWFGRVSLLVGLVLLWAAAVHQLLVRGS
jgi:hypothetical protein